MAVLKFRTIGGRTVNGSPDELLPALAHELAELTTHERVMEIVGFTPDNTPPRGHPFWDSPAAADIIERLIHALESTGAMQ